METKDFYAENQKMIFDLTKKIKQDIKKVYNEKGFTDEKVVFFHERPYGYKGVEIDNNVLYFYDDDNDKCHSDRVNDIDVLMSILKAMYHLY
jgi:UDP-2,3-diacylglucosamine pyrophosphatase LpxH